MHAPRRQAACGARRPRRSHRRRAHRTARERAPGSRLRARADGSTMLRSSATAAAGRATPRSATTVAVRAERPTCERARARARRHRRGLARASPRRGRACRAQLSRIVCRAGARRAEAAAPTHGDRGVAAPDGAARAGVPCSTRASSRFCGTTPPAAPPAVTAAAAVGGDDGASGEPLAWDSSSSDGGGGEALLDPELLWDQGYLNAERLRRGVPLANLGYAFNYLGSFETDNKARAPRLGSRGGARDAFFVHGTTGLRRNATARLAYFEALVAAWEVSKDYGCASDAYGTWGPQSIMTGTAVKGNSPSARADRSRCTRRRCAARQSSRRREKCAGRAG